MRTGENVQVAEGTLDENGNCSIKEKLSGKKNYDMIPSSKK